MIDLPKLDTGFKLDDYGGFAYLSDAVADLRREAETLVPRMHGRTVWMVNSTARGGGVAEMLPKMVALLNELGLSTRWAVIGTDRAEFFEVTKRLHNLIHGEGASELSRSDAELYEAVNAENANEFVKSVQPEDVVVIHDPQPLAMAGALKKRLGVRVVWRCHIGLDEHTPATRTAWSFLQPYAAACDRAVFSAPEYIPDYLAGRSTIIHPALDPQSHKNRELSPHKLTGVLCNAELKLGGHPVLTPRFREPARRLGPDGRFVGAATNGEIGLLYRPIVTQISRWDRLKGFAPLLEAFVRVKHRLRNPRPDDSERHRRRLEIVRLVLAGPDPATIQDDPEGLGVLDELCDAYKKLPEALQQDIAVLVLPMRSRKQNALMVNALQRCSTVVVQNSIREGFGLTATEAMWKGLAVVGTMACGLRTQIRDGIDGLVVRNASDPDEIAARIEALLRDPQRRDVLGRSAQRRVHQEFLIFTQLRRWLRTLADCVNGPVRQLG
jgi:trehalose synthase